MAGDPPGKKRASYFSWLRVFVRRRPKTDESDLDMGFLFDDDPQADEEEAGEETAPEEAADAEEDEEAIPPPESIDEELEDELAEPPRKRRRLSGLFRVRSRIHPIWGVLGVLPFAALIGAWFWATAGSDPRVPSTILPTPDEVVAGAPSLWHDGALMRNILLSLRRVLGGFGIAAGLALPLGIAMASFSRIGATFGLFCTAISYLPIIAIAPVTMAWWGIYEKQKMGFLALATFAYLLPLVVRHVNAVDHQYVLSAYAQGASAWQVVRRVLVPVALPDIVNALRLCLGIGWTYIVLAEMIGTSETLRGVGNLIEISRRRQHWDRVYLILVAIMVVGAVLDRLCVMLSRWLFPYRAARTQK